MENNLLAKIRKRRRIEKVRKKICCIVDVDLIAKKSPNEDELLFISIIQTYRTTREREREM